MNRIVAVIAIAACAAAGAACKKKSDSSSGSGTGSGTGSAAPPAPPPRFTGALTIDRVMGAKDLVKPFDDWTVALARLEGQMGSATKVDGDTYQWAVVDGESCAYTSVERDARGVGDGKATVGTVTSPMKTTKTDGPVMNHRDCLAITGKSDLPPEDPDAPEPPADGTSVPVTDFLDVAVRGRSKWKDKQVAVAGVFAGTTTSTSGDHAYVTVSVRAAPDDTDHVVSCSLVTDADAPELTAGQPVIATGKVEIKEWMSMGGGETRLEPALAECTVAAAPAE